jgi:hypothetical protein
MTRETQARGYVDYVEKWASTILEELDGDSADAKAFAKRLSNFREGFDGFADLVEMMRKDDPGFVEAAFVHAQELMWDLTPVGLGECNLEESKSLSPGHRRRGGASGQDRQGR